MNPLIIPIVNVGAAKTFIKNPAIFKFVEAMDRKLQKDTGPGIPKEIHSQLFDHFVQLGGRVAPGSGLGLALVKQMVTLMSGTIHFESDPLVVPSTTCIMRLPLEHCENACF
jgi:signal transduction histidine kinase